MRAAARTVAVGGLEFVLDDELVLNYGGFGVVVRAHDAELHPLAVKVMVASAPHVAAAAVDEREVLDGMLPSHAHIIGFHSYFEATGADMGVRALCRNISAKLGAREEEIARKHRIHAPLLEEHAVHLLAFELLRGSTLFEMVSGRPALPELQVRRLFHQLACAISHCHSHAIAHLDLKLENVMVEGGGESTRRLVLLDFGLARRFPLPRPLQDLAHPPGSPTYIAPEVREACTPGGSGVFDGLVADIFSLGVLLFGLATGAYPWADALPTDPVFRRFSRTGQLPTVPSEALSALLHAMLDLEPSRRPSIEEILRHPWLESEVAPPVAPAIAAPVPPPATALPLPPPPHEPSNSQADGASAPAAAAAANEVTAVSEVTAAAAEAYPIGAEADDPRRSELVGHATPPHVADATTSSLHTPPPVQYPLFSPRPILGDAAAAAKPPAPAPPVFELNLDDGPALILGPVPIERRVPITRGDVQRAVQVRERIRLEKERADALFASAFGM